MLEVSNIADYLLEIYSSVLRLDHPVGSVESSNDQSNPQDSPAVNLDNCTSYLDRRLLALSWFELRDFFLVLHKVSQHIIILRDFAAECKFNGQGLTAPQAAKVQKLSEMLESLPAISTFTPVIGDNSSLSGDKVVSSFLPDQDYIQAYIFKVRSKLKTIEEMAASKKTEGVKFRFSGKLSLQSRLKERKVFDLAIVRKELKDLQDNLELLEHYLVQYENLFTYFASIKKYVHRYYQDIILAAATLPSLEEFETKMKAENESFATKELDYNSARSNEALIAAASARKEMLVIEQATKSMMMDNLPIEHILGCLRDVQENAADDFSDLISAEHLQVLKTLLCGSEHDLIGIFSEQEIEGIEAAFRALGSYIVHRFDYTLRLDESFEEDDDDEREDEGEERNETESAAQDVSLESIVVSENHEETQNAWIEQVHNFELDLFIGLIQRWKEMENTLDETIRSENFETAYEELQQRRVQYCSSAMSLEKVMERYKDVLDQHLLVSREVAQFKDRFCKVVKSELNQSVDVEVISE